MSGSEKTLLVSRTGHRTVEANTAPLGPTKATQLKTFFLYRRGGRSGRFKRHGSNPPPDTWEICRRKIIATSSP